MANYYISPTGNDTNPGTITEPWLTIGKANTTLIAGDTVYIRAGTYTNQQIKPSNNGTEGNYITYQNYNDESVVLSGHPVAIYLYANNYIDINGIRIEDGLHGFTLLGGSNYNIIQNCTIYEFDGYWGCGFLDNYVNPDNGNWSYSENHLPIDNNHNQILNNTFENAPDGCPDIGDAQNCGTSPSDWFRIERGKYNIISGNFFGNTAHDDLVLMGSETKYNVIRNNTFQNEYRRGLDIYEYSTYNLIEDNKFYGHGRDAANNPCKVSREQNAWNHGAIQCIKASFHNIIRNNIFDDNGHVIALGGEYIHFYHNTTNDQIRTVFSDGGNWNGYGDWKYNKIKNNIFSNTQSIGRTGDIDYIENWQTYVQSGYVTSNNEVTHNTLTGTTENWRWQYNKTSFIDWEATTDEVCDNLWQIDPLFINEPNKDFALQVSSPMINAGAWLTTITSSTNTGQTVFIIDDAGYFYDGWGISDEVGDVIKTAGGKETTIQSINYTTNTLTVLPAIDIVNGEGISLTYEGSSPNIGADQGSDAYYVDTDSIGGTASDSNSGTITSPWLTIGKANTTLVAGDTVFLRAGKYGTINPTNNGTSENRIIYQNYNNETVVIEGDVMRYDGARDVTNGLVLEASYISIIGLSFIKPIYYGTGKRLRWFHIENVNNILVKDCDFSGWDSHYRYAMSIIYDTTYSVFNNCTWDASDTDTNSDLGHDLLNIYNVFKYNLFIDCEFGNVAHNQVYYQTNSAEYNVFRNCDFHNKWRHCLTTRYGPVLIDNCTFHGVGAECQNCPWFYDRCTNNRIPVAFYPMAVQGVVFRNNTMYDSTVMLGLGTQFASGDESWIYNNTMYNTIKYACTSTHSAVAFESVSGETNIIQYVKLINNIFSTVENNRLIECYNYNNSAYDPINNIIGYNIFYDPETNEGKWGTKTGTIEYLEDNHADWVDGTNIVSDPLFVNTSINDFTLQLGSPAINTGTFLTTITSVTNTEQTTIIVDSAIPFYSGAGAPWLIEGEIGDIIRTAGGKETTIQSINYTTNTLTVLPAIDIVNGEGIALNYTDSAPDIGAKQYIEVPPPQGTKYKRFRGINRSRAQFCSIGRRFV